MKRHQTAIWTDLSVDTQRAITQIQAQGKQNYGGYKLLYIQHINIAVCPEGKLKIAAAIYTEIPLLQDVQS